MLKKIANSIKILIVSVLLLIYFFFIVAPWALDRWFFGLGGVRPNSHYIITYSFMVLPVIMVYIIFLMLHFRKIEKFRVLIYPAVIFTLFMCFYYTILIVTDGERALGIMFLATIPVLLAMVISVFKGLKRDRVS